LTNSVIGRGKKKSYQTPQLTRVELNHQQAILAACSITATNAMMPGINMSQSGSCKGGSGGGGDSGPRAS